MRKHDIWVGGLLAIGLLIRLLVMRWPPFPIDMNDWIAWGEHVLRVGPSGFYTESLFSDYAPGYVYVMWLTAAIKNALLPNAGLGTYYFLYRITPILFDLATTVLIYVLVVRTLQSAQPEAAVVRRERLAWLGVIAAACYVLNPAIIFNSAIWGQVDASFTFFMLLTLALMLYGQPEAAVASYVVAFLIKPQSISIAPVLAIMLLLRFPWVRWLRAGTVGVLLAFVILFPFFGFGSFLRLITLLNKSVETYPFTSLFTYNLWGVYGFWKDDTVPLVGGLTLRTFGTLLYIIGISYGLFFLVRQLRRSNFHAPIVFCFATYFTFLPVMVLTRMHERYLYPVLPFLLLFALMYPLYRSNTTSGSFAQYIRNAPFAIYLCLTVLHTINLYQVYIYYLNYPASVPQSNVAFYFIDQQSRLWSVLTLLLFVAISVIVSMGQAKEQRRLSTQGHGAVSGESPP